MILAAVDARRAGVGRDTLLHLGGRYTCRWQDYSRVARTDGQTALFRYLPIAVGPAATSPAETGEVSPKRPREWVNRPPGQVNSGRRRANGIHRQPGYAAGSAAVRERARTRPTGAKLGWKWSILTDLNGIPSGVAIDGANRNDSVMLAPTLDNAGARGLLSDTETPLARPWLRLQRHTGTPGRAHHRR